MHSTGNVAQNLRAHTSFPKTRVRGLMAPVTAVSDCLILPHIPQSGIQAYVQLNIKQSKNYIATYVTIHLSKCTSGY